jgi:hypothetical protein
MVQQAMVAPKQGVLELHESAHSFKLDRRLGESGSLIVCNVLKEPASGYAIFFRSPTVPSRPACG